MTALKKLLRATEIIVLVSSEKRWPGFEITAICFGIKLNINWISLYRLFWLFSVEVKRSKDQPACHCLVPVDWMFRNFSSQGSSGGFGTWTWSSRQSCTVSWLWSAPIWWPSHTRTSSLFSSTSKTDRRSCCCVLPGFRVEVLMAISCQVFVFSEVLMASFVPIMSQGCPETRGCCF